MYIISYLIVNLPKLCQLPAKKTKKKKNKKREGERETKQMKHIVRKAK